MLSKVLYIFAIALGFICIICLGISAVEFIKTMTDFNTFYTNELTAINVSAHSGNTSLYYMEQLQQLQETTSNNNMMAFLYSAITTVLIGLGAGLISWMNKNVDDAKGAATDAKNVMPELKNYIFTLSVLTDIANARSALSSHHQIEATDRIKTIRDKVCGIVAPFDEKVVVGLQGDLLRAQTSVEDYRDYAKDTYKDENDGTRQSILTATNNWERWLNKAIRHCDVLLGQIPLKKG